MTSVDDIYKEILTEKTNEEERKKSNARLSCNQSDALK